MGKLEVLTIVGILLILIGIAGLVWQYFALSYPWKREVHDYFELSWDSGEDS